MRILRNSILATTLVMTVMALTAFAQGPLHKRVNFSINVPYTIRMGEYTLPAGDYVLRQVSQNDLNLFALYPKDLTHEPIAMIRTTRIYYPSGELPEKTQLLMDVEGYGGREIPVLEGWNIPGMDGWQVIGVVESRKGSLDRLTAHR